MREIMNIEARKPVLVDTQTKSMNLKMSRTCPLKDCESNETFVLTKVQSAELLLAVWAVSKQLQLCYHLLLDGRKADPNLHAAQKNQDGL